MVLPTAPQRPITINGGMVMNGWYDIISFSNRENEDGKGIREVRGGINFFFAISTLTQVNNRVLRSFEAF